MRKRRKFLYKLAVNLFLGALAVISALVGVNYFSTASPLQSLLVNLSTELAGVVIIFLIVDTLFLLDRDQDLLQEISQLKDEIKTGGNPFRSRESAREEFDLRKRLLEAETLDLLGYGLANLLGTFREELAEAITKGTHIRIMILNPSGTAGDLMREHIVDPDGVADAHKRSARYISDIRTILKSKRRLKGSLDIKLISWIPSCYLTVIDGAKTTGVALIGINSFMIRPSSPRRLNFILRKEQHTEEFYYFTTQYNLLWQDPANKNIDADEILPQGR